MKEMKKSAINGLKKDFRADDKLEKLVIDYAIRKTTGSRKDLNGVYYSKNGRHLLMASKSLSGKYTVNEGVREIDADAFWGCAYLEQLELPEGIESIGHEAFGKCISLRDITIPKSVRKVGINPFFGLKDIRIDSKSDALSCDGKAVYSDGGRTLVAFVSDDKEFSVPEGVECIGEKAFSGKSRLQRISLPQTLRIIDDEAFFDCDGLLAVTVPERTEEIGDCAFGDCLSLRKVDFIGIPQKMKRTMLAGCENIREICIPKDASGSFKKVRRDFDDRVIEKGAPSAAAKETPSAAVPEPKPKRKEKEKTKDKDKAKAKEKNKDKHKLEDMTEKRKSPMYR